MLKVQIYASPILSRLVLAMNPDRKQTWGLGASAIGNRGWEGIESVGARRLFAPPSYPEVGSTRKVLVADLEKRTVWGLALEGKGPW